MKRTILVGMLFFAFSAPLFAKDLMRLAVYGFEGDESVTTQESDFLSAVFLAQVSEFLVFDMVTRTDLESVLAEQELSMTGFLSDEEEIELGNLLSAECVVSGDVYKMGSQIVVDVEAVHPETGELYYSGVTRGSEAEIENKVRNLAHEMAEAVSGKNISFDIEEEIDETVSQNAVSIRLSDQPGQRVVYITPEMQYDDPYAAYADWSYPKSALRLNLSYPIRYDFSGVPKVNFKVKASYLFSVSKGQGMGKALQFYPAFFYSLTGQFVPDLGGTSLLHFAGVEVYMLSSMNSAYSQNESRNFFSFNAGLGYMMGSAFEHSRTMNPTNFQFEDHDEFVEVSGIAASVGLGLVVKHMEYGFSTLVGFSDSFYISMNLGLSYHFGKFED